MKPKARSLLFSQVFGDIDQGAFDSNAIMELIDALRSKVKGEQIELARAQISQHRKMMESKHNKTIQRPAGITKKAGAIQNRQCRHRSPDLDSLRF